MMRIAGILLAVTAVTLWATSFMFARYTTGGKADDTGRVARFSVGMDMDREHEKELLIDVAAGGEDGEYIVMLINNSETAVSGDIVLDFTEINTKYKEENNPPIEIIKAVSVAIDGTDKGTLDLVDNKVTIKGVKNLTPNGGNAQITVKLGSDGLSAEAIKVLTKSMTGLSSSSGTLNVDGDIELPFDIKAIFTQID
jgi:hypothetical protein